MECVIDFNINYELNLPSNHAPISLTFNCHSSQTAEAELLFQRPSQLDLYVALDKNIPCNKPIPYETINALLFDQMLLEVPVPVIPVTINTIDECMHAISNTVDELAGICRLTYAEGGMKMRKDG